MAVAAGVWVSVSLHCESYNRTERTYPNMKVFLSVVLAIFTTTGVSQSQSQQASPNPEPDKRYKADILEVVGHPDDDIEVTAYVAKLIEQQHKRVAGIYTTRGNRRGNYSGA